MDERRMNGLKETEQRKSRESRRGWWMGREATTSTDRQREWKWGVWPKLRLKNESTSEAGNNDAGMGLSRSKGGVYPGRRYSDNHPPIIALASSWYC